MSVGGNGTSRMIFLHFLILVCLVSRGGGERAGPLVVLDVV